jgi:hypothetical protein
MRKILLILLPFYSFGQVPDATIKTNTNTYIRNTSTVTRANHALINDQLTDSKSGRVQAISLSGTDTYTVTISWATSYQTGLNFLATFVNANTGSATLNINGLGAKTFKKFSGGSKDNLASGDISAGQIYQIIYDGTDFQVSIPSGGGGGSGTVTSVSVATANGFSGSVANATTTPAITLSLQDASGSQSGKLTSSDWSTFNGKVSSTRTISTTSPITGGGDLSANRTIAINQATTSTDGYLSSTDWNTFNGKANVLTLVSNATDANFTATLNGVHNILDGVATSNRVITIPTGANGDVIEIYNTEDTYTWSFTGATVYLADRVTVQTTLLYNVPCFMKKIDGRWIITD